MIVAQTFWGPITMYKFELLNNHYIVTINHQRFLLDTGSPSSFLISHTPTQKELMIDDKSFKLSDKPNRVNGNDVDDLVGIHVDGFIGLDIINQTGLTIYKKGEIDFKVNQIKGNKLLINKNNGYLNISVLCNGFKRNLLIDTGARYGYGVSELFINSTPINKVKDYSPVFGMLDSYQYDVEINNKKVGVCYNRVVEPSLKMLGVSVISNITSLYEEVCVLNTMKGEVILK